MGGELFQVRGELLGDLFESVVVILNGGKDGEVELVGGRGYDVFGRDKLEVILDDNDIPEELGFLSFIVLG